MRVGIIGGGLAGLTAAYQLAKRGIAVELFEKEAELGGQAGTFLIEGTRLERFYHHIFTSDHDIANLIKELGLGDSLQWLDSKMGFFHGGKAYDFVTPLDLLRFSPLPFFDRVKAGVLALYLQRLDNWKKFEGITAKDWIERYAGKAIWEVVWGSQLRGKFGDSHDQISMVWFWGKMKLRFGSRRLGGQRESLGYLKGSFQVLIDELERRILAAGGKIYKGLPIERILAEGGKVGGLRTQQGETFPFDRIVATVPSHLLLQLVPEMPEGYAELLRKARYQASLCLILKMKKPLTNIYWLNLSAPEMPFCALIEHTNYIPPEVYGGKHLLYISNYLETENPLYSLPKDELSEEYIPHLKRINPDFDETWVEESWLFRDEAAQPLITCHYSRLIPPHKTPIQGLYLANTTQIYPEDRGMNYSVRLGNLVADMVAEEG